jgi:O-antigen/teichoic acid export membrane protein
LLSRNSEYAAVDVLATTVALFVVFRLASSYAGVAALGEWSLASALTTLCNIADLGVTDAMVRQVPPRRRDLDGAGVARLVVTCLSCAALLVGIACVIAVPLVRAAVRSLIGPPSPGLVEGAALVAFLNVLAAGLLGTLEGFERYGRRMAAGMLASAAAVLAAALVLPARGAAGLPIVFVVRTSVLFLAAGAFVWGSVRGTSTWRVAEMLGDLKQLVMLGLPLRVVGLSNLAFEPMTRIFLAKFGSAEAIGIYEIVSRITTQVRGVMVGATQVIVPRLVMVARTPDVGTRVLREVVNALSVVATATFIALMLALPVLSLVVLRRVDTRVVVFGTLLSVAWLVNTLGVPAFFSNIVDARPGRNVLSQLTVAGLNVILGAFLGTLAGPTGVVAGTTLALAGGSILTMLTAKSRVPQPLSSVAVDAPLWLCGLGALGVLWLSLWGLSGDAPRAVVSVVLLCMFAAAALLRGGPRVRESLRHAASSFDI